MATQAIEQAPDTSTTDEAAAPKKGGRGIMILAVAGIAAGAAAGLFGLGPVLAKRRAAAPHAPKVVSEVPSAAITHAIENLVLNPAGSGGTRFLMVTASFELKDSGTETFMKEHEAEVRDHILALLGRKTVEELSDISQRDRIKKEVLDVVSPLFPPKSVYKVFFSQFVIQ